MTAKTPADLHCPHCEWSVPKALANAWGKLRSHVAMYHPVEYRGRKGAR